MVFCSKPLTQQIARFVLVFLFFTQAALAMSGCLMPATGLATLVAAVDQSGCDDASGMNLNLCHAHCTADQQSLDTGELPPLPPQTTAVLVVPLFEYREPPTFIVSRVAHTGDPPKPIRFCSLQI